MGLFWGSDNSGDTSGKATNSAELDLSSYGSSSSEGGFASKKRSSDFDFGSSTSAGASFESSAAALGAGGDMEATIQAEQQKMQLMSAIHKITDMCWDTCVDSVSSSLGSRSENCLRNCADRFVDTTLLVTNRFSQLASKMQ